jgi:hypothetical protein
MSATSPDFESRNVNKSFQPLDFISNHALGGGRFRGLETVVWVGVGKNPKWRSRSAVKIPLWPSCAGEPIHIPLHYFPDDNPNKDPPVTTRLIASPPICSVAASPADCGLAARVEVAGAGLLHQLAHGGPASQGLAALDPAPCQKSGGRGGGGTRGFSRFPSSVDTGSAPACKYTHVIRHKGCAYLMARAWFLSHFFANVCLKYSLYSTTAPPLPLFNAVHPSPAGLRFSPSDSSPRACDATARHAAARRPAKEFSGGELPSRSGPICGRLNPELPSVEWAGG